LKFRRFTMKPYKIVLAVIMVFTLSHTQEASVLPKTVANLTDAEWARLRARVDGTSQGDLKTSSFFFGPVPASRMVSLSKAVSHFTDADWARLPDRVDEPWQRNLKLPSSFSGAAPAAQGQFAAPPERTDPTTAKPLADPKAIANLNDAEWARLLDRLDGGW